MSERLVDHEIAEARNQREIDAIAQRRFVSAFEELNMLILVGIKKLPPIDDTHAIVRATAVLLAAVIAERPHIEVDQVLSHVKSMIIERRDIEVSYAA